MPDFVIENLARGMGSLAPVGALSSSRQGPLWRKLINMVPHDGRLRRRAGTVAMSDPSFDDTRSRAVRLLAELSPSRILMVTSREVLIGDGTWGWVDVTPVHSTGTVSITNGTKAVTGSGTTWQTLRMTGGQLIELPKTSGSWWVIDTVNSDTSITLEDTFTGTTLAGANYQIRRNFVGDPEDFFWVRILDDLYLGGMVSTGEALGAPSGATVFGDGGIIKIPGGAAFFSGSAPDPANSVYVLSGAIAVESGVDNLGYNITPKGLSSLPDGRLVMPVLFSNLSSPTTGVNRVIFSSHLDTSIWTVSPGGFTDISDQTGSVTALDRIGRDLLLHFDNGHEIGELTGEADKPLRWYRTDSTVGAIGPRASVEANGQVFFIGSDLNLRVFSGQASQVVLPDVRKNLVNEPILELPADALNKDTLRSGFMRFDPYREEVSFYFSTGNNRTREVRVSVATGDYSLHEFAPITCATTLLISDGTAGGALQDRRTDAAILGAEGTSGWLWRLDETKTLDAMALQDARGPRADLDYLDFGEPASRKVLTHLLVGYISSFSSATIEVEIRRDGQAVETLTMAVSNTQEREEVAHLTPDPGRSGRIYRIRFQSADDNTFVPELTRLVFTWENTADVRVA